MAGTPEKMLEHLLETRINKNEDTSGVHSYSLFCPQREQHPYTSCGVSLNLLARFVYIWEAHLYFRCIP